MEGMMEWVHLPEDKKKEVMKAKLEKKIKQQRFFSFCNFLINN